MQRSPLWLGLASWVSILAGYCAVGQASGDRAPSANADSPRAAAASDPTPHAVRAGAHLRHAIRDQVNSGLVTIILGGLDSGDLSDATDLVTTLGGAQLRVLPVAGEGATKDVIDLLFARGVDIGIVQADVLASLKQRPPFPGVDAFLQYITKMYDEEIHILAGNQIHSLADLAFKRVNFGPVASGTFLTASNLFNALGIGVEITTFPEPLALSKLRSGEIAALVYASAKPARLFQAVRREEGLHFLSIPAPDTLRGRYDRATLSAADYPGLIDRGKPVSTLAVGTVLAVYNWPPGTERYRNVAHFVDAFFGRLAELRLPRHHPKWREVDIDAPVPGWTRFAPAVQWIKSAERDRAKPTRVAGPPLPPAPPMEGSTASPAQIPSAGSGELEPSVTGPAISHPNDMSAELNREPPHPSGTANTQEPATQAGDQVSFNAEQLEGLFRDFVKYEKREVQNTSADPSRNEALFAEFQAYVRQHWEPPGGLPAGAKPRNFGPVAAVRE